MSVKKITRQQFDKLLNTFFNLFDILAQIFISQHDKVHMMLKSNALQVFENYIILKLIYRRKIKKKNKLLPLFNSVKEAHSHLIFSCI